MTNDFKEEVLTIASDWDFKERHGIKHCNGSLPAPDKVKEFLQGLLEGPAVSMQEVPPMVRGLLCAIADAFLAAHLK
jgi:hypothetical protein